jgi:hypothetical protein
MSAIGRPIRQQAAKSRPTATLNRRPEADILAFKSTPVAKPAGIRDHSGE